MGRFLRKLRRKIENATRDNFEDEKPAGLKKDIRMISG
jgi:hypothetical protein